MLEDIINIRQTLTDALIIRHRYQPSGSPMGTALMLMTWYEGQYPTSYFLLDHLFTDWAHNAHSVFFVLVCKGLKSTFRNYNHQSGLPFFQNPSSQQCAFNLLPV